MTNLTVLRATRSNPEPSPPTGLPRCARNDERGCRRNDGEVLVLTGLVCAGVTGGGCQWRFDVAALSEFFDKPSTEK